MQVVHHAPAARLKVSEDGTLRIPAHLLNAADLRAGDQVAVRLGAGQLAVVGAATAEELMADFVRDTHRLLGGVGDSHRMPDGITLDEYLALPDQERDVLWQQAMEEALDAGERDAETDVPADELRRSSMARSTALDEGAVTSDELSALTYYIISAAGRVEGRTRLMKLIYLTDLESARTTGRTSGAHWFRYRHGPMSKDIYAALAAMDGSVIAQLPVPVGGSVRFEYACSDDDPLQDPPLLNDPDVIAVANRVVDEWAAAPLEDLLAYVYDSEPFRSTRPTEDVDLTRVFPPHDKPHGETPATAAFRGVLERMRRNEPAAAS